MILGMSRCLKWVLLFLLMMLVLVGVGLIGMSLWWRRQSALAAPGATLIVAGIAGIVSTSAVATWGEKRLQDLEQRNRERREDVYSTLAEMTMRRYVGGVSLTDLAAIRARVAVWAGVGVVQAQAEWNKAFSRVPTPQTDNRVSLTVDDQQMMTTKTAALVAAMRNELDPTAKKASEKDLTDALFDPTEIMKGHGK